MVRQKNIILSMMESVVMKRDALKHIKVVESSDLMMTGYCDISGMSYGVDS